MPSHEPPGPQGPHSRRDPTHTKARRTATRESNGQESPGKYWPRTARRGTGPGGPPHTLHARPRPSCGAGTWTRNRISGRSRDPAGTRTHVRTEPRTRRGPRSPGERNSLLSEDAAGSPAGTHEPNCTSAPRGGRAQGWAGALWETAADQARMPSSGQ